MTNPEEKNILDERKTNGGSSTLSIDDMHALDITGEVCPMTFVRTRLALDRLAPGSLLRVILRGEEPRRSVPENAASLGHAIMRQRDFPDGTTEVVLRRT